jgi:hypothetical protein
MYIGLDAMAALSGWIGNVPLDTLSLIISGLYCGPRHGQMIRRRETGKDGIGTPKEHRRNAPSLSAKSGEQSATKAWAKTLLPTTLV